MSGVNVLLVLLFLLVFLDAAMFEDNATNHSQGIIKTTSTVTKSTITKTNFNGAIHIWKKNISYSF